MPAPPQGVARLRGVRVDLDHAVSGAADCMLSSRAIAGRQTRPQHRERDGRARQAAAARSRSDRLSTSTLIGMSVVLAA